MGPWQLELGARPEAGLVRFSVWAPRARVLEVKLPGPPSRTVPMSRGAGDVFTAEVPGAGVGDDYVYVVDGRERPDPVSRWQPHGVHGPSRVVDPRAFAWTDAGWNGPSLRRSVLYELHVGTFTGPGTFAAAIGQLPHLQALGVTAIELMPVAEFPGARNWGYDGVCLYAPHSAYGGPEGLRRLVDACHARGLGVVLDVVYNHLGPEGNYLADFGPYFTSRRHTPWGEALNFDGEGREGVRRHFVQNARYWLEEFHVDALRLDAVQNLFDDSPRPVLAELVSTVEAYAQQSGRQVFAIAESNQNDARLLEPTAEGGLGLHAQWSDDFHHALHATLTGDRRGYFQDFGPLGDVRKALTEGFVNDGRHSAYRGRRHGTSSARRPGHQLVAFAQNHDQVANGAGGERHSAFLSFEEQKLVAALLLAAPSVPLLFMGQEWGETAPFHYFTSHGDAALSKAVSAGRARDYAWSGRFTDPAAEATFQASTLRWEQLAQPAHAQLLRCTTALIALRRITPALHNGRKDLTQADTDETQRWLRMMRREPGAPTVIALFNFQRAPAAVPHDFRGRLHLALSTAEPRFGGPGGTPALLEAERAVTLPGSSAAFFLEELHP